MIADSLITDTLIANPLHWETVKLIINSQHNLAVRQQWLSIFGISVLVGVALLIIVINLWSIRREVRRDMENTIERLRHDLWVKEAEIEKKVDEKLGDVDKTMQRMDKKIELTGEKMAVFDASKARLFAISAWQSKVFNKAASWWAWAIIGYANPKVDDKNMIRISVDELIKSLEKCFEKDIKLKDEDRKKIKEALSHIPKTLNKEKKEIEGLLKKLPKE